MPAPKGAVHADADYADFQSMHSELKPKPKPIKPSLIKMLLLNYRIAIHSIRQRPKQNRPSILTTIHFFLFVLPIATYYLYILFRELDPVLSRFPSLQEAMPYA